MESYGNMNSSNGRQYRNLMNQGCRTCDSSMQGRRGQMMTNCERQMNYSCESQAMQNCDGNANQDCARQTARNRARQMDQNYAREMMHQCENQMMQNDTYRTVEGECSCDVKEKKKCHTHDKMKELGCNFPVVMSYVPWQQWGELYEAEYGLKQGTIFKDLNFIFCGERC